MGRLVSLMVFKGTNCNEQQISHRDLRPCIMNRLYYCTLIVNVVNTAASAIISRHTNVTK